MYYENDNAHLYQPKFYIKGTKTKFNRITLGPEVLLIHGGVDLLCNLWMNVSKCIFYEKKKNNNP